MTEARVNLLIYVLACLAFPLIYALLLMVAGCLN